MTNELVINSSSSKVDIALLSDKRLIELHRQQSNSDFCVGDIYLGRVKKVMDGLNAAFVDVGYGKDGFLHYQDLGSHFNSLTRYVKGVRSGSFKTSMLSNFIIDKELDKGGKISEVVKPGEYIPVQVTKEPISSKGPRISAEISMPGRFLVLIPFSDKVSVSAKITNRKEKSRLKNLIKSIKPKNFGVIIRTVAQERKVAELDKDLKNLVKKWSDFSKNLKKAQPKERIHNEMGRTSALLRDYLNDSFSNVYINDDELFNETKSYLQRIAPKRVDILKHHTDKHPIFDSFGISKQIKSLFGKTVTMKSGAYLVIEHTEALHVVDVNSGNTAKKTSDQEANALAVNMESAVECARQFRLRDMGGIIVIDFIDLKSKENQKLLFEKLKEEMSTDRAKHKILPPSQFGLIQITRQRVRPEMDIKTDESCPTCAGTGEIQASILLVEEIERMIGKASNKTKEKEIIVCTHPYTKAYIQQKTGTILGFGGKSIEKQWYDKFPQKIKVVSDASYHMMEYHIMDKNYEDLV